MNESEVERVAALMHAAFNRHYERAEIHVNPRGPHADWADLHGELKDRYRAVARAVLADLYCLEGQP